MKTWKAFKMLAKDGKQHKFAPNLRLSYKRIVKAILGATDGRPPKAVVLFGSCQAPRSVAEEKGWGLFRRTVQRDVPPNDVDLFVLVEEGSYGRTDWPLKITSRVSDGYGVWSENAVKSDDGLHIFCSTAEDLLKLREDGDSVAKSIMRGKVLCGALPGGTNGEV